MLQWRERATGRDLIMADELEIALRKDTHDLFHDDEFVDGCDICDKEFEENQ